MNDSVKFTHSKVAPKIGNRSKLAAKVDPSVVARAFGAEAVGSTAGLDVFGLRDAITSRLLSSGGRPSLDGADSQVKIPRIAADWRKLERITKAAENLPHRPSITQAAALVLHVALSKMSEDELEAEMRRAFGSLDSATNSSAKIFEDHAY